ncbi:unnamed protein product [Gadus morhua 'NCC']
MVGSIPMVSGTQDSGPMCTSCGGEAEATSWCVDCGEALCRGCVEAHKRVKVTRSHHILDQLPADVPRSDSAPTGIYCPLHREEVLQLYCYTCDVRTCRDCQLMDHRAHSFQYVHEAYQSIRKQMYGLLVPVDKHTEKAMQSIMLMSSRLKEIHSQKVEMKVTFLTLVKSFCLHFKERLSNHYAQVAAIYTSEEEVLKTRMKGLMEKVEDYTVRIKKLEDDASDIKTLLARKTEISAWSEWILSQEVGPPKTMTKPSLTINTAVVKAILSLGELRVSQVPFACKETNPQECLSQPLGGVAPPPAPPAASTATASLYPPPRPATVLPQTRRPPRPAPPQRSASHPSVLGSARPANRRPANRSPANRSPANRRPANRRPANRRPANRTPANRTPANRRPANRRPANRRPANRRPANRRPANRRPANRRPANRRPANRTPANRAPANRRPANRRPANRRPANSSPALLDRAFRAPAIIILDLPPGAVPPTVANPPNQPPYCVLPVGTTFYPILSSALSGFLKDKTGGPVGGPGQKVIMLGAPITSTTPTVVLDSDTPVKRKPGRPKNSSYHALCKQVTQTIAPSAVDPATPLAFPWGGFPSRGAGRDAEAPAGHPTQNQIQPVTEEPRPPPPPPSERPLAENQIQPVTEEPRPPPPHPSERPLAENQIQPPSSDPRGTPPSQGSAPDHQDGEGPWQTLQSGPEERLWAPNIQENELTSTVSDPAPPGDVSPGFPIGLWPREAPPADPHGAGWAQTAGASAEDPAGPETPGGELVAPRPPGEGAGRAAPGPCSRAAPGPCSRAASGPCSRAASGPCSLWPVVSLYRLPLSAGAPGCPTPRYRLHAGDTEQEMFLEELMDDDLPRDEEQDSYLQPLSSPGSPEGPPAPGSLAPCACCHALSCDAACSRCERSFHGACHVPPGALSGPEWVCSLCQDLSDPRDPYASERRYTPCLSLLEQRKCECVLLSLLCQLGDPTEALALVQKRLCHLKNPPYRTSLELITDLQLAVDLHTPSEDAEPSLWEGLQLTALLGVDPDPSLRDPQQPASPPGDPGPGRDADREERAAHGRGRPTKRSRVTGRDLRANGSKSGKRRRT